MDILDSVLKRKDITLLTKVHRVKAMVFPVVMYRCELDYKEGWVPMNWWFQTVVLENALESLLDCREIEPLNPEGNQPWIFIGRTDAEGEAPLLWPHGVKSWLIGKDPAEEKLRTGGEGDDRGWDSCVASLTQWTWIWIEGQGSLACCSPWGCKELETA